MANTKNKIINDPVFGFITIPGEFIYKLLQHPIVLRLNRIKQLGLTSYVYPGTQHTRFQHSIGALHLMTEAISVLRKKGVEISDNEAEAAYAAILLHDIGHSPFSHLFERFFFPDYSHEDITLYLTQMLNSEFDGKLDLCLQIMQNTYHRSFLHDMVSGQLDMDRLDYIRRDSFFSGVCEGNIGSERIIKMLDVRDNKLVVEAKGIYSIENFLTSRYLMYWQVYFHKTCYGSEKMLFKALSRAKYLAQNGKDIFTTNSLNFFFKNTNPQLNSESIKHYLLLDDSDIWTALKVWAANEDIILSTLSDGILNRKLFKMEISQQSFNQDIINNKITEIANRFNISEQDAAFLTAQGTISQHIYKNNESKIGILFNDGTIKSIYEVSDLFDINIHSKTTTKYYFCYIR